MRSLPRLLKDSGHFLQKKNIIQEKSITGLPTGRSYMTPLCDIARKYGTDKSPYITDRVWGHSYTPVYYEMFKDKTDSIKKVLEIGVGAKSSMPPKVRHLPHYVVGASLYM